MLKFAYLAYLEVLELVSVASFSFMLNLVSFYVLEYFECFRLIFILFFFLACFKFLACLFVSCFALLLICVFYARLHDLTLLFCSLACWLGFL